MTESLKLPVGIESFEEIRSDGYYYVDKTKLIEQLVDSRGKVNLFTRPRRFGKTLNMSMLKSFFEIGAAYELFDGLYISHNKKLCDDNMGKYPVIFLSLKNVEGLDFQAAKYQMIEIIAKEAKRFAHLKQSDRLDIDDKSAYASLIRLEDGRYEMRDEALYASLQTLSELLYKHHCRKTVILIDEYDVPLDKAFQNGYYKEMVSLIRAIFGKALKTNEALDFAVLTGCLRVSKESIFTGLNNFKVYSITDVEFDETFGFTNEEVKSMLKYYGLDRHFNQVREWYDGYRFGNADVYCPWDVVNYCDDHRSNPNAEPKNYWMNTSGNDVINHFIDSINDPGMLTKGELERLVNGEFITQKVDEMITYKELYSSIDNLWSTLFMTGYLTQRGYIGNGYYRLAVPNREICNIIIERVLTLFRKEVAQNGKLLEDFCNAIVSSNEAAVEQLLTEYMEKTISIRDNFARSLHENFYHGLMIGILGYRRDWEILSNRESGDGFSDILIETTEPENEIGVVIELKYSSDEKNLDTDCRGALQQIEDKNYVQELCNKGYRKILKYGIAFYHKKCRVMVKPN